MKNRKLLKILFAALAVVACGVVFTYVKGSANENEAQLSYEEESSDASFEDEEQDSSGGTDDEAAEDESSAELLCVHVCGAVKISGVYYLEAGSRVNDAVNMAGGLSEDAAGEYVNLARELEDGEQIYIPTLEEAQEQGLEIGSDSASGSDSSKTGESSLININTASSEELQSLPGIGEAKAQAIITYRENNGDFSSIEEITEVSGIGESTYENIKDYITV